MTRTTFLGLGAMGGALAMAAVDADRPIVVWNRTPHRAQRLGERGAVVAGSVEEAVAGDGVIVACLLDHRSVRGVLDPVAARLSGRTLVNLTTTTPNQARDLATWAGVHGIDYLDGAVMAVPAMIGGPGSTLLYSGSAPAFEKHRTLLELWGESSYLGIDAGLASLYDLAILSGMYTMFAGFTHGAAMVGSAGVPATEFATRAAPFLAAMTGSLAGTAAAIDARNYAGEGQQSLEFTQVALDTIVQASIDQGVSVEVLRPVRDLVHRQVAAGHGTAGTDRIFEEMRSTR
ncbi:3-hydroxyisobutyrate dehydrogenase [Micromonospora phaseoli]|uniref:3-hydroxyisobutyrate dehydrogenase n=1 Tax=Micromonospora phaseoli TaxID=1144548 RepID=A0A1H6UZX4_9ACTN|nr:NAD(P)-binding domain-containing protein [Micromonospora phaseoli]PZV99076.1 3-hydroxyisobutyrate dehydrogenase-like beta-hydroxyacid dehydrogenase [Micromonospora phaseoli]GIJ78722.1 oxidoreductase [Micromonospora phaseoli]SEI93595.1 3-hydroxyisobutyrate dehydrogenase [Micromonospora phaseoli]